MRARRGLLGLGPLTAKAAGAKTPRPPKSTRLLLFLLLNQDTEGTGTDAVNSAADATRTGPPFGVPAQQWLGRPGSLVPTSAAGFGGIRLPGTAAPSPSSLE